MSRLKHICLLLLLLIAARVSSYAQREGTPGYPAEVSYGVNNFARITVHELPNGLTRFFLPNKLNAKRVMLSGNFNSWSTLKGVMLKTDSGWIRDIHLDPDVYNYKFIIDGKWHTDEYNNLIQDDQTGNLNSVYYRYNFTFKLPGHSDAHRVTLTGDFNKWQPGDLIMNHVANGWELHLYIHEGVHQYHFLVDGNIVTDPANKFKSDNNSSVLNLGEPNLFKLAGYEHAKQVYVAGTFNKWNPQQLALKNESGKWVLPYALPPGNYQYKFIVDGGWITDPANNNTARYGGVVNSFVAIKPNYTFRLKGYRGAKNVKLSGTFNDWDDFGYSLAHTGDEWVVNVHLNPGKNLYKFIVDGKPVIDPDNKLFEKDSQNSNNSLLWVN